MVKSLLILYSICAATGGLGAVQPVVRIEPARLLGPRPLLEQTKTAAIRDYLQSWKSLSVALEQNSAALLDPNFVGTAREKLTHTIQEQASIGIRTSYTDRTHDIQMVFYSPEGLSIELIDKVEYDVQVLDHDKVETTQRVNARYIVVLTPAEVQWRVRIFQVEPD